MEVKPALSSYKLRYEQHRWGLQQHMRRGGRCVIGEKRTVDQLVPYSEPSVLSTNHNLHGPNGR